MLYRKLDKTDPCGRPLFNILMRLVLFPISTWMFRSLSMFMMMVKVRRHLKILLSFNIRPFFHTVSYAADKSMKTTPVFSFFSKPNSMNVVRAKTWSQQFRLFLKPACSTGVAASMVSLSRATRHLSKNLRQQWVWLLLSSFSIVLEFCRSDVSGWKDEPAIA